MRIAPDLETDDEERVYRNIRRMTLGTALYRQEQISS